MKDWTAQRVGRVGSQKTRNRGCSVRREREEEKDDTAKNGSLAVSDHQQMAGGGTTRSNRSDGTVVNRITELVYTWQV